MEIRIKSNGKVMTESEYRQYLKTNNGPSYDVMTDGIAQQLGVDIVFEGPQATGCDRYQYSMRSGVEQINGKWFTRYVKGPVFNAPLAQQASLLAEYKSQKDAERATTVRAERNRLLADCDWTQVADAPVNKAEWATYRQALRDITTATGFPWDIVYPTQPTN